VLEVTDTEELIAALQGIGVRVLATTVDGETSLDSPELESGLAQPTAWLFGPEAHGLATDVATLADVRVQIPMRGGAESLNVAAAAAICLYQSARAQS
jgi:TrmH family RNA methyltransferase